MMTKLSPPLSLSDPSKINTGKPCRTAHTITVAPTTTTPPPTTTTTTAAAAGGGGGDTAVGTAVGTAGAVNMTTISNTSINSNMNTSNCSRTTTMMNQNMSMRLNRTWNVECPPAKMTMVGRNNNNNNNNNNLLIVPTAKSTLTVGGRLMRRQNKRRRVAIEIHGPETTIEPQNGPGSRPQRGLTKSEQTMSEVLQLSKELLDDDKVIVRILKPRKIWGFSMDPEDSSTTTSSSSSSNDSCSSSSSINDSVSLSDSQNEEQEKADKRPNHQHRSRRHRRRRRRRPRHDAKSEESPPLLMPAVATTTLRLDENDHKHFKNNDDDDDAWVEYRKYDMDEIVNEELTGQHKRNIFVATMGLGAVQERRELKFDSEEQAQEFWTEWQQLKALVKERANLRLATFQQSNINKKNNGNDRNVNEETERKSNLKTSMLLTPQSEIQLLIEIVSATDLPAATDHHHRPAVDPYILIYLGQKEIHRTHHIHKTLNPIWTIETGCFCLLSISAVDFFQASDGLTFLVKNKDTLRLLSPTSDDELGRVSIPQSMVLQLTGEERVPLPLSIPKRHKYHPEKDKSKLRSHTWLSSSRSNTEHRVGAGAGDVFAPTLYIRVRRATPEDRQFMKQVVAVQKKKLSGVYADETFQSPQRGRVRRLKRREFKVVDGVRRYRVKPHPDPNRPEQETKWISSEMLLEEVMKPTHEWIEAGSGSLGKLYLEILKCDGLPKMDFGIKAKADPFCCVIYEDAIVNTDVIDRTCKPRWVPWCQRGFCFRIAHPSSQVLIGVFDYDTESSFDSHDPIGRITIDVTNLRRDTEYVLTYDLYRSVLDNERPTFGTLTVRLRVEYDSFRDFVKGSFYLPPVNFINLPQKHAFKTSYFVIHGKENLERFDLDTITAYRAELEGYLVVLYYLKKAAISLFLWRGHFEFRFGRHRILLPLHSAVAFFMGITLIENLNLIPSYFLFSISWLLLATNEARQKNPSSWRGSLSCRELWYAVLANQVPPVEIEPYENEDAILAYEEEMKTRKEGEVARARERRERIRKIEEMFEEERKSAVEAFQAEDIATKLRGPSVLNPLAKVVLPVQQFLERVCIALRITTSIVLWDESIYAFIIVNVCLMLGVVLLWIPWSLIVRWSVRITIWVFLGPWMKLVDIFYVRKQAQDGIDEAVALQKLFDERLNTFLATRDMLFRVKEGILKTRDMKRFMFGNFVARVPQLKEYRYSDVPRAESFAKPIESPPEVVIKRRFHGQTLVGHMIPKWADVVDHEKLTEKTKKKMEANIKQSKIQNKQAAKHASQLVSVDGAKKIN